MCEAEDFVLAKANLLPEVMTLPQHYRVHDQAYAHFITSTIIYWIPMRKAGAATGGARVWDEAFHPVQIESKAFFEQKLDYLHDKPVRAGHVTDPCEWKYSSAGFYHRDVPSVVPITPMEW